MGLLPNGKLEGRSFLSVLSLFFSSFFSSSSYTGNRSRVGAWWVCLWYGFGAPWGQADGLFLSWGTLEVFLQLRLVPHENTSLSLPSAGHLLYSSSALQIPRNPPLCRITLVVFVGDPFKWSHLVCMYVHFHRHYKWKCRSFSSV